jgi:hypothetical protein
VAAKTKSSLNVPYIGVAPSFLHSQLTISNHVPPSPQNPRAVIELSLFFGAGDHFIMGNQTYLNGRTLTLLILYGFHVALIITIASILYESLIEAEGRSSRDVPYLHMPSQSVSPITGLHNALLLIPQLRESLKDFTNSSHRSEALNGLGNARGAYLDHEEVNLNYRWKDWRYVE